MLYLSLPIRSCWTQAMILLFSAFSKVFSCLQHGIGWGNEYYSHEIRYSRSQDHSIFALCLIQWRWKLFSVALYQIDFVWNMEKRRKARATQHDIKYWFFNITINGFFFLFRHEERVCASIFNEQNPDGSDAAVFFIVEVDKNTASNKPNELTGYTRTKQSKT